MYFQHFSLTLQNGTSTQPGDPLGPGPYLLFLWGQNPSGQLGQGNTTNRSSPVQVSGLWKSFGSGGGNASGVKSDGTMWCWGSGSQGQIGNGSTVTRSVPTQVGLLTTWKQTACASHVLAQKTDGTLWGWGLGTSGQLGDGTIVSKSTPIQIGTDSDWLTFNAGAYETYAIKNDSSLWVCGANSVGQLGAGDTVQRSTFVQVGTGWKKVIAGGWSSASDHFAMGIKSDGTLWGWGSNNAGQLGVGDTINRSSPTQIGSATDWVSIAPSNQMTVAIKSDGTLWGWGVNSSGYLGLGDIINRSSPTQIGSATDWVLVNALGYASSWHALKNTGALWGCGYNNGGQLGDGTTVNRTSLVSIGAGFKNLESSSSASLPNGLK